jgi:hypothetical protein
MDTEVFDRQIRLFGAEGQARIEAVKVAVVGAGGTGSHTIQQLAYLGVRDFTLIDADRVDRSSLNRLVGGVPGDASTAEFKVDVAERLILRVAPSAQVLKVYQSVISGEGLRAVESSNFVFGCVDKDPIRFVLNEVCQVYERSYLDIATDVDDKNPLNFGGRLIFSKGGQGCVHCLGVLDDRVVQYAFSSEAQRAEQERIYGVLKNVLNERGPSVISLNGVLASLAVTEFMVDITGLRQPRRYLVYRGFLGIVVASTDEPAPDCYYCKGIRGRPESVDINRWLRDGWGGKL